jgi:hypothetical protein
MTYNTGRRCRHGPRRRTTRRAVARSIASPRTDGMAEPDHGGAHSPTHGQQTAARQVRGTGMPRAPETLACNTPWHLLSPIWSVAASNRSDRMRMARCRRRSRLRGTPGASAGHWVLARSRLSGQTGAGWLTERSAASVARG